jgi:hypothetical protein
MDIFPVELQNRRTAGDITGLPLRNADGAKAPLICNYRTLLAQNLFFLRWLVACRPVFFFSQIISAPATSQ